MIRILQDDMAVVVELMKQSPDFNQSLLDAIDNTHLEPGEFPLFYMFGTEMELDIRLKEKGKDSVNKYLKYPLVALRLPSPRSVVGGVSSYTINMAIMMHTSRNLNAEQRTEEVFKPILYPLLEIFFKALRRSGLFTWSGKPIPEHTQIDRMYWGRGAGDKQY